MRISEAAERTGLSISNIRFYEKKGLLEPEREKESRYRDYNGDDIRRLNLIVLYRKMDLSLEQISDLLQKNADLDDVLTLQMENLKQKQAMIEGSLNLCEALLGNSLEKESDIEFYLNYVKEKEEKGVQFGNIEEFLLEYASMTKYDYFLGPFVLNKISKNVRLYYLLRYAWAITYMSFPILFFVSALIDQEGMNWQRAILCLLFAIFSWFPIIDKFAKNRSRN